MECLLFLFRVLKVLPLALFSDQDREKRGKWL